MKWSRSQIRGCPLTTQIFLIVIYILCTATASGEQLPEGCLRFANSSGTTIPSGDIIRQEGEDLEIYCTLREEWMMQNHKNSSDIVFYHDATKLSQDIVEIVNETSVRLHIKNITRSLSKYYCKLKNSRTAVCYNIVAVDVKPLHIPKSDFQCKSYNWQNLTCKWRVPEHYVKTNYTLTLSVPGRVAFGVHPCPINTVTDLGNNEYECSWGSNTTPHYRTGHNIYKFELTSKNRFGETNDYYEFNHFAYVIPSATENLTIVKESLTAHSALLEWNCNIGLKRFPPGVVYQLSIQSEFDDIDTWEQPIEFRMDELKEYTTDYICKYKYPLNNLKYAYTMYTVNLRSRSFIARGDCCWSANVTLSFRTLSARPDQPPRTDIGSFEIYENPNNNLRDVYIYWQQIKSYQENGPNFTYSVRTVRKNNKTPDIKSRERELVTKWSRSFANFTLDSHEYLFEIVSTNDAGNSNYSSSVRVPSLKNVISEPRSLTKIVYENNVYELSWNEPLTDHRIKNYTIFWCKNLKDRPYQCTGYLNWTQVNSNVTIWNRTMEDDGTYQFAISANTETSSSGMVWTTCTVIHNKLKGKMKNFNTKAKGPNLIEVNWKLECSDRIGIVSGFKIYYCAIEKQEDLECIESEKNITLRGDSATGFGNIQNLKAFTLYRIYVAVITRNAQDQLDEGPRSDPKFSRTSEDRPGKPLNANIIGVTNTTISIAWDPPNVINGVLRHFELKYRSVLNMSDTGAVNVTYDEDAFIHSSNITKTISGLRSYTRYNIELVACTVACSDIVYLNQTTLYGVPDKIMNKITTNLVNDTLVLEWIPPLTPGGPIFYELKSEYKKDGHEYNKTYDIAGDNNQFRVIDRQVCESDTKIKFKWQIRAVVLVDNRTGERFEGPWNDPITVPCGSPPPSPLLMYCILIIFLLMAICLFTFYGNKVWIHCKDMRNVEVKLPPGLTTAGGGVVGDTTHWNPQDSKCIMPQHKLPKDRPITDTAHHLTHHIMAADEQLLLEKKRGFDSELTDLSVNQSMTMTMNLSNSETASVCNSSNESEISSSTPITNLNLSIDNNSSSSSDKDNCSLRLRNVQMKPPMGMGMTDSQNPAPWTKGYVTLPTPDKNDQFASGPWSKAMQLKPLDGYSQIGVDGKQMQAPPPAGSGYVPHAAMSQTGNTPAPSMSISNIKASPQSPENITNTGVYLLPKPTDDLVKTLALDDDDNDDDEEDDDDDDDDVYNLSEQDSPLVDLEPSSGEFSSIETDDLINIDESGMMYDDDDDDGDDVDVDVTTGTAPGQPSTVTSDSTTPYVSLATAMSRSASQRDQSKLASIVDNAQLAGGGGGGAGGSVVQPTQSSSAANKPTIPNPYSRIGIWDNKPTSWIPPTTTGVGAGADVSPIGDGSGGGGVIENKEFVLAAQLPIDGTQLVVDKTQPASSATTTVADHRPPVTAKSSGYVPYRQFDCKLFKED